MAELSSTAFPLDTLVQIHSLEKRLHLSGKTGVVTMIKPNKGPKNFSGSKVVGSGGRTTRL